MKKFDGRGSMLLLLGWGASLAAGSAAASERNDANSACRQEIKRVVVWPHGSPKAPPAARVETREVTVCDAKASRQSNPESNKS